MVYSCNVQTGIFVLQILTLFTMRYMRRLFILFLSLSIGFLYGQKKNKPTAEAVIDAGKYAKFELAIADAIAQNKILELPDIVRLEQICGATNIKIIGNITMRAKAGHRASIIVNAKGCIRDELYAIETGQGTHTFENIDFVCGEQSINRSLAAVQTTQADITCNNIFKGCKFIGDWRYDYQSSIGHGGATFINCQLRAWNENIQLYSQQGSKDLIMKNVTVSCDSSHNIYSHYNNYDFDSVVVLQSGKLGLNSYQTSQTIPTKPTFQKFNRCFNASGAKALAWSAPDHVSEVMWRLASNGAPIEIKNSAFPIYEWRGNFNCTNSKFWNAGNGCIIPGNSTLTKCTGEVWMVENTGSTLKDCSFEILRIINSNNIKVINTTAKYLWYKSSSSTWTKSKYDELFNLSDSKPKLN